MFRHILIMLLALVGISSITPACTPRMAAHMFSAAAVLGTVAVIAHHDAHMHHYQCGCHRRWYQDQWVYHYDGRWEYYDRHHGRWYYYY
ncbi:MAG: hypothetical protein V1754_12790 [Pseudomonadota bacterium]